MEWLNTVIDLAAYALPLAGDTVLSVVGGASIIAAAVAPRKTVVGKIAHSLLNKVAFNVGCAKNANADTSTK